MDCSPRRIDVPGDPKEGKEEIRRLRRSINDLISIQALPAIWNGRESGHIVGTLLDVLVSMLRLNFAYARLGASVNGSPVEFVRLTQRRTPPPQPQEIGRALDCWLTNRSANAPLTVPNPTDDGEVRIVPLRLGLMDEIGVLVAGSKRADFPTPTETLLLRVAANQAVAALQEARQLHEQRRAAEELELRVADRTARLTTANEALRESEKKYRTLFDSMDEGFCTIEVLFDGNNNPIDYRFLEVNPSFEKQTGIQNARGRRMREIAPQHEEHWFEIYGRIALTGEPVRFENQAAQLQRWYDVYAFRVGEPGDRKVAILFNDITERKQAEAKLRQSESNLAEAQRLTHTGSWVWRVAGREAAHLSEEWDRIYGFDPEDGAGDLAEFVGSATDITERKRAEMLLGGEKRLLEMIARGDSRALVLEGACRVFEELASGSLSSILLLDPKTNRLRHGAAPSLPITYTEAIDGLVIGPCVGSCGTAAYRAEQMIVCDIATDPLWADYRDLALGHGLRACWSTPILSSTGKVLGTFAIYYREPRSPIPHERELIEQITHLASIAVEREQAEEALRQAQADLAHVSRVTTMGELTASIAHEVNQPLTAVVNNANACLDLLPKAAPNVEEVREALAEIIDDADRASAVILHVRQLAKRAPIEKSLLDLRDVVKDVLALARYESAARRVTIHTDLPEDLPSVSGDRVQLQQVLLNLVMNGMEAMNTVEESKRVLTICGRLETRGGMRAASLRVQDSGTGFKPEEMDRLFEAFYTTKPQGMGMGLAISRSIIEAHGGRLWAEPNQGPGATFLISLPSAGHAAS